MCGVVRQQWLRRGGTQSSEKTRVQNTAAVRRELLSGACGKAGPRPRMKGQVELSASSFPAWSTRAVVLRLLQVERLGVSRLLKLADFS